MLLTIPQVNQEGNMNEENRYSLSTQASKKKKVTLLAKGIGQKLEFCTLMQTRLEI